MQERKTAAVRTESQTPEKQYPYLINKYVFQLTISLQVVITQL